MPVSVCGEMAANPKFTPLLLGLGLRNFSMNASAVPRVKQACARSKSTPVSASRNASWTSPTWSRSET